MNKIYPIVLFLIYFPSITQATLIELADCVGANTCEITNTPPNPVTPDPNNGILLAWDEVQNFELLVDLRVDRVFDPLASFVVDLNNGDFLILAGTIVSSHYLQWDPGVDSAARVTANIRLDSQVFAFITSDQNLFDSDYLGLVGLDYNDFGLRGLESGDTTVFNGPNVDISWAASTPGDWTRLITAFSPAAQNSSNIPEPSSIFMLCIGLIGLAVVRGKQSSIS